jgi:hypothetical protein
MIDYNNTLLSHYTRITAILHFFTSLFLESFGSRTIKREIDLIVSVEGYRRFWHYKNCTDIRYISVNNFYIVEINRNYMALSNVR